jgi:general secretion pathway protein A
VARDDLERAWSGHYWAVWRAPPLPNGALRRGDAGGAVDWVRERLLETGDATFDVMGPAYYDAAMEAGVRRLQSAHGLVPDGIIGPETLFALDARDEEGPRLRRSLP